MNPDKNILDKTRRFKDSFRYAIQGIVYAWKTQRNVKIHLIIAILVLILSFYLRLGTFKIIIILLAITLVIVTEMINTAIEAAVDLFTNQFNPLAKTAKDVAAGAVLLTSIYAVIVAVLLFFPYFRKLLWLLL